jgi:cytidylate kinase
MRGPRRIAIDGPAGSGKSTIGEQLADHLGYLYVDTGAMYRALAWLALHKEIDISNGPALGALARQAEIAVGRPHVPDGRQYTVTVSGQDITWEIRAADVTRAVSPVSAHPEVRSVIIAQQRAMGEAGGVVMVGRDIGAVVLPDAELKIYLMASSEERARRRRVELLERYGENSPAVPSFEDMLCDIQRRDELDRARMIPARDAIFVETDHLNVSQVLDHILQYVQNERYVEEKA